MIRMKRKNKKNTEYVSGPSNQIYLLENHRLSSNILNGYSIYFNHMKILFFDPKEMISFMIKLLQPPGHMNKIVLCLLLLYIPHVISQLGLMKAIIGTRAYGYNGENITATSSKINYVRGVTGDSSGNLYFADTINQRIRKVNKKGIVSSIAGIQNFNIPASAAFFSGLQAIWRDSIGTTYFSEVTFSRIKRIDPVTNIMTVFAGAGFNGYGGDGQLATLAFLNNPYGLWGDSNGQFLYFADFYNNRIRRISFSTNIITTFAGTGASSPFLDNCTATAATLYNPRDIQGDGLGSLYIVDFSWNRLRKILPNNIIITIAGTGTLGFSGDGGLATLAMLNRPNNLHIDTNGDVYVSDTNNNRIRKITSSTGIITTVIGTGVAGLTGDNGPGTSATVSGPKFLDGDSNGFIYFSDSYNNRIRKYVPSTGIISSYVNGGSGFAGDGGLAAVAKLSSPCGLFIDTQSNMMFIADSYNNRIRNVSLITNKVGTFAGNTAKYTTGTIATSSMVHQAVGVWADTMSNVYFTDTIYHVVVKISALDNVFTIIAGNNQAGFTGDNVAATTIRLYTPIGLWGDSTNTFIYVADSNNHRIRKINLLTNIITTVAGTGSSVYTTDNILAIKSNVSSPNSVWSNLRGELFISDYGNARIRKVDTSGIITTLAGTIPGSSVTVDGVATSVIIGRPNGIAGITDMETGVDTIIFTDNSNRIRRISSNSNIVKILAGTGSTGYNTVSDTIVATSGTISNPYGLWIPPNTTADALTFVFADYMNAVIRQFFYVSYPTGQPTSQPTGQPTRQPTRQPTGQPSRQPTSQPTRQPVNQPTGQPSRQPTSQPTGQPSRQPTGQPSRQPASQPTGQPSRQPTSQPTRQPVNQPTGQPTRQPTSQPTGQPSRQPTSQPTRQPSRQPTGQPSRQPTSQPTGQPTRQPSTQPTRQPSTQPSSEPSCQPTRQPSTEPTSLPSGHPSSVPTTLPTSIPTNRPTSSQPTFFPTFLPSVNPTETPSMFPTYVPSNEPSVDPTASPSSIPTEVPTEAPTEVPSSTPTEVPSITPSAIPTEIPTEVPSVIPTEAPTEIPSYAPSELPTEEPSNFPTETPSDAPTEVPSFVPSTVPSMTPSNAPTETPSNLPSELPTEKPTAVPSFAPSTVPSEVPTVIPSYTPTNTPTKVPSIVPTIIPSNAPTEIPSTIPSELPTQGPSNIPTKLPSVVPSVEPSEVPSVVPSITPTVVPSLAPSVAPTAIPSAVPSMVPSLIPTTTPSMVPSFIPSEKPSKIPSVAPTVEASLSPTVSVDSPHIVSAVLSSDGLFVSMLFSMATDHGGLSASFACNQVFSFVGVSSAVCQWQDDRTIAIYPDLSTAANIGKALTMGSSITLIESNSIKKACLITSEVACAGRVVARSQNILVTPPATPIRPIVIIKAPSIISSCNDLHLDFTASTGDGGRGWKSTGVEVKSMLLGSNTSVFQNILQKTFSTQVPVSIPNVALVGEETYVVDITLCNLFYLCHRRNVSVHVSSNTQSSPLVGIAGASSRSIYTTTILVVSSSAFVMNCNGRQSSAGLSYSWRVKDTTTNEWLATPLLSQSKDPSKLIMPSYSFVGGKSYQVQVQVTDTISKLFSDASVFVEVLRSPLVLKLQPSSMQLLRLGSSLAVDGSGSFDPDTVVSSNGGNGGIRFAWSCRQVMKGQLLSTPACPLSINVSSVRDDKLSIFAVNTGSVNTTSRIFLTVSDGARRNTTSFIDIVVIEAAAPLITMNTLPTAVSNMNNNKKLLLSGSIVTETGCDGRWSVNDARISLAANTIVPYQQYVGKNVGGTPIYLYLGSNVLSTGGSYVFTLSCGASSASIEVTTNAPPFGGSLSISPLSGTELSTTFTFISKGWIDLNLPISYQFGFISTSLNAMLSIQSMSEVSYSSSQLPAGSSPSYGLSGVVLIYDSLGASTKATQDVIVNPADSKDLQSLLSSKLNSSSSDGSLDSLKQTISIASSILSRVNCSLAPKCALLYREECSATAGTCGKCLAGYVGSNGDGNSKCVLPSTLKAFPSLSSSAPSNASSSSTLCTKDDDCNTAWEYCGMVKGSTVLKQCQMILKPCMNGCSGNGKCVYHEVNTGATVATCNILDNTCDVSCSCDNGFGGRGCELSIEEVEAQQRLRLNVLSSLSRVVDQESASEESILNIVSSVSSLIREEHDIDIQAVSIFQSMAESTFQNALNLPNINHEEVSGLLQPLDATLTVCSKELQKTARRRKLVAADMPAMERGMGLLSTFSTLLARNAVPGQEALAYSNQNFRVSTQSFSSGNQQTHKLEVPQTTLEAALGQSTSKVEVPMNGENGVSSTLQVQVIEIKSKLMTFAADPFVTGAGKTTTGPKSNALTIVTQGASELFVKLQHHTLEEGSVARYGLKTHCLSHDDYHEESYVCPDSGHLIRQACTGQKGNITTECPKYSHGCSMLNMTTGAGSSLTNNNNNNSSPCRVWNYTTEYTYCRCIFTNVGKPAASPLPSQHGRRLDDGSASQLLEQSNAMTLVSMSSFLASDVDQTFTAAPALTDAKAIERVLTVIIMFSTLWLGGLSLIFGCIWKSHVQKPMHEQNKEKLKRKSMMNEQIRSPVAIYEKITEYVHTVFPAVYNYTSPLIRLKDELRKNHRYLKLFTAPSNEMGDQSRILTGVQLLTTQGMLMFFLALFYDLQGPDDDGSCVQYSTQSSCLSRKSMLDTSETYCSWGYVEAKQSNMCSFNDNGISFLAAIYAAVIVSIVSSLFMKPLDYFFDILSAPTADALKAKLQGANAVGVAMEQKMVAVAQGVKRAARRMSAFASNAVQQTMTSRRTVYNPESIKAGALTRHIPEEVNDAHELARSSMVLIANTAQAELQRYALRHTILMKRLSVRADDYADESDSDSCNDSSSESSSNDSESDDNDGQSDSDESLHTPKKSSVIIRPAKEVSEKPVARQRGKLASISFGRPILEDVNQAFVKLEEEIHSQRRLLQQEEVEDYDMQWGLDPSGEFVQEHHRSLQWIAANVPGVAQCCALREGAMNNIKQEMVIAQKESSKKIEKLSIATDTHIGMEILHTFILDMLGRDTAAATIFRSNTEEEFRHASVVTMTGKYTAGVVIFALNVFFAYYSVLKGFVKGVSWQYDYLLACIVQLLVEILLFETLECLWMNFFVPSMVAYEVQEVHTMLIETVNHLCHQAAKRGGQQMQQPQQGYQGKQVNEVERTPGEEEEESRYFLNAPEYLFVSTNMAKAYPELMESMIVLSYHTHLPGELSKKWQLGSNVRIHRQQQAGGRNGGGRGWRNIAMIGIGIAILQSLAASPFFLQRMMIRFVQPFVLGGLMLMWVDIMNNTWSLGIFCAIISLLVLGVAYRYYHDRYHSKGKLTAVTPENSVMIVPDNIETIPFVDIPHLHEKHTVVVNLEEDDDESDEMDEVGKVKDWSESEGDDNEEEKDDGGRDISGTEEVQIRLKKGSSVAHSKKGTITGASLASKHSSSRYSVSDASAFSFGDVSSLSDSTSTERGEHTSS